MNPPLVSILIPCFNAQKWVGKAIESTLAQTWANKEVIVVDDGSTDQSLQVISAFGEQIHWETGPNRGGNAARNRLLELARGKWVQYPDADDYLLRDKIAKQVETLVTHADVDILYSPVTMEYISEAGTRQELLPIPEPHDPWVLLARWYLPQTGAPLWRKAAILDVGGWKADQPCCQEHELYLRLLMAGKRFIYSSFGGAVYRQWGEHTVCKRNKPEVHRRRMDIERHAEEFLREAEQLTPVRLQAINQARFETARSAWQYSPTLAEEIIEIIKRSEPGFFPVGAAAPGTYGTMYRWFGFRAAERLADLKRWLSGAELKHERTQRGKPQPNDFNHGWTPMDTDFT